MDCNFCGKRIAKCTETIYVTKKGKALYFCSSKCENNMVGLKRKPRKTKWTAEYRKEKDARLKLLGQDKKADGAVKKETEKTAPPKKKAAKKPDASKTNKGSKGKAAKEKIEPVKKAKKKK
ncbi:hypothetical protein ACFLRF_04975 [Candidatus Altiarchaeota archaeon]